MEEREGQREVGGRRNWQMEKVREGTLEMV